MNSSRNSLALLAAAGLTLATSPAHAQGGGWRSSVPPERGLDEAPASSRSAGQTDRPGMIKEINAEQFEAIDRNHDGLVSLGEFTSSQLLSDSNEVSPGQSATVAAPRSDGTVLIKPAPGRNSPELFRRLDRDRDGFLDPAEIAAFYVNELED